MNTSLRKEKPDLAKIERKMENYVIYNKNL